MILVKCGLQILFLGEFHPCYAANAAKYNDQQLILMIFLYLMLFVLEVYVYCTAFLFIFNIHLTALLYMRPFFGESCYSLHIAEKIERANVPEPNFS